MNTWATFSVFLLAGLVSSNPVSEVLTIDEEFFPDSLVVYTSQHDIVNLFLPLNSLNFEEDTNIDSVGVDDISLFFIEADIVNDVPDYKGLYLLKNNASTLLLENARDFAASCDGNKNAYFAATDGIYVYNAEKNEAEKYGTLTDSFIGIAVGTESEFIYALSEDHILYKVTNDGTSKEVISDVKDAVQIMTDLENNLYFIDGKKSVYVKKGDSVTKIKGLPHNPTFSRLIRPPFVLDAGVPYISGKKVFNVYPNGTSEYVNLILKEKPTAYSTEGTLIQYYAYDKKIYKYNLLELILGEFLSELKSALEEKADDIRQMGSNPKKAIRNQK